MVYARVGHRGFLVSPKQLPGADHVRRNRELVKA